MGETRTKKLSKRALKDNQKKEAVPRAGNDLREAQTGASDADANGTSSTSDSSGYLTPSTLSSDILRSSLRSSSSSSSRSRKHKFEGYEPSRTEVRATPNKGNALFAACHIPKGAIVLAEIPAIRLTAADESRKLEAENILLEKFDDLPKTCQKKFRRLHDARKDGFSRLRSVYHSNCYNLDGSRSTSGGSCIGIQASRINHSCIPNVQFSFLERIPNNLFDHVENSDSESCSNGKYDPAAGVMLFRALRPILKDKEIVSNYETVYATRGQRQSQLQMHYGFRCDCEACTATTEFWANDDDRRQEMMKHRRHVDTVEDRVIAKNEVLPNGSEATIYYLKQGKLRIGAIATKNKLLPLSVHCCDEMIKALNELVKLLTKEGLVGIELQRVLQERVVWTERAQACVWSTKTSC